MECDCADCSVWCRISNAEACQTYPRLQSVGCVHSNPDAQTGYNPSSGCSGKKGPKTLQQGAVRSCKGGDGCASVQLNLPPGDESEAVTELQMKQVSGFCPNCATPATSAWGIFSLFLLRILKQLRRGLWTWPVCSRAELSSTWRTTVVVSYNEVFHPAQD